MTYLLDQGMKPSQLAVGCAQLGANKPIIKAATAKNLAKLQIQKYPQCLIIPSPLHFMEEEALQTYK
jgi:diphthamide biosynthesis methyltransferase